MRASSSSREMARASTSRSLSSLKDRMVSSSSASSPPSAAPAGGVPGKDTRNGPQRSDFPPCFPTREAVKNKEPLLCPRVFHGELFSPDCEEDRNVLQRRGLMALVLVAGLAGGALAQEAVTLKPKFEANKSYWQEMTTSTEQNMKVMGTDVKQKQDQTFWYSWTPVKQESDGSWVIEQKIEGVKMSIDIGGNKVDFDSTKESPTANPLGDFFKALVGSKFTITLKPDFTVAKIDGRQEFIKKLVTANPQMEQLLNQILSEQALKEMAEASFGFVKDKEVKKGEWWEKKSKLDMGPIGSYENTFKYTYEGKNADAKEEKDKKLDKIKVETTLKYFPPSDPAAGSTLPFRIKSANLASTNAGGTILFDNDKGRIASSDMSLQLKGDLQIEIGGQTTKVDLDQTQTTKVTTSDEKPKALEKKS